MADQTEIISSTLLSEVSITTNHHKEIERLTGENFNIFRITRIGEREVTLHSRFIGELLNPKGSHGAGGEFLKLFLKMLSERALEYAADLREVKAEDAIVDIEKSLGPIDLVTMKGGSIDILIHWPNGLNIIIENKINAVNQRGQLRRYYNSIKGPKKNTIIFYMSLFGREATNDTTLNEEDDFKHDLIKPISLSYQTDVLNWIEDCRLCAIDQPMVRETLNQYVHQLKYLTHQNTNKKMEEKIMEIVLKNSENTEAAIQIHRAINQLKEMAVNTMKQVSEACKEYQNKNQSEQAWPKFSIEFVDLNGEPTVVFRINPSDTNYDVEVLLYVDFNDFSLVQETHDSNGNGLEYNASNTKLLASKGLTIKSDAKTISDILINIFNNTLQLWTKKNSSLSDEPS